MGHCYSDMIKSATWSVYLLEEREWSGDPTGYIKIGSARAPKWRVSSLIAGNPRDIAIVFQQDLGERRLALIVEKEAHAALKKFRQPNREWFRCEREVALAAINDAIRRTLAAATKIDKHPTSYRIPV